MERAVIDVWGHIDHGERLTIRTSRWEELHCTDYYFACGGECGNKEKCANKDTYPSTDTDEACTFHADTLYA